ncbi:MAG: hypothetical protein ACLFTT_08070 [Candidatus Hydrogenedentota bacterium]
MRRDGESLRVLDNIEKEGCLSDTIVNDFFSELAKTGPWANAHEAWEAAKQVVFTAPKRFQCKGNVVENGSFAVVIRFLPETDIDRLASHELPKLREAVNKAGIRPGERPSRMTDGQRERLCRALEDRVQVGRSDGIACVADSAQVPWDVPSLRQTLRCLGIPNFETESWVIVLRYPREKVPCGLQVPRALDGIDHPPFRLQEDCTAKAGMTKPIPEAGDGARGYPEAIHRSEIIDMLTVDIRPINGPPSQDRIT